MRAVIFDLDHTLFKADKLLHDGVSDLLAILERLDIKIGALSSDDHRALVRLDEAGIGRYFTHVLCSDHVEEPKTPSSVQHLLEKLGVKPEHAAMVSHAHADILLGKEAGLAKTIGVTHGRDSATPLREAGADHLVGNIPAVL